MGLFKHTERLEAAVAPLGIFFHGNGDDLGSCEKYCRWLGNALGIDILAVDYPGYGLSTGNTTEQSIFNAAHLVYKYARDHLVAQQMVIIGKSLGTGPAVFLTSHDDVKRDKIVQACILISPFASGFRCLKTLNQYMPESSKHFFDMQFMHQEPHAKPNKQGLIIKNN